MGCLANRLCKSMSKLQIEYFSNHGFLSHHLFLKLPIYYFEIKKTFHQATILVAWYSPLVEADFG